MALNIGELVGYVKIDADGVEKGAKAAESAAAGMAGKVGAELDKVEAKKPKVTATVDADTAPVEEKVGTLGPKLATAAKLAGAAAGAAIGGALAIGAAAAMDIGEANAKFRVQLGGNAEYASQLGEVSGNLFARGYADNMGAINDAVLAVVQSGAVMEDATNEQIESIAAQAMTLGKVFDVDVSQAMRAVGKMVQTELVPTAEEGMDLVTAAFQQLGPNAEDVIDTLTEYPVQFQALGLSGSEALGLITQMMDAGARNTDLAADALKEFAIRAVDGSKTSVEAYQAMGLNADEMAAKMARGGADARDVLSQVTEKLNAMPPSAEKSAISVALFGTKAEDLQKALGAIDLDTAAARMGTVAGSAAEAAAIIEQQATQKVQGLKNEFTQLTSSMIATEGPMGTVAAAATAFGPQALSMAGSFAMIALAIGPAIWQMITWAAGVVAQGAVAVGSMLATAATMVAQWVMMAAGAMARAAIMAASWIVAMGPVGWVIALVVGLVALIIANWDTVKEWTAAAWQAVSDWIKQAWEWIKSTIQSGIDKAKDILAWFASLPSLLKAWWDAAVAAVQNAIGAMINWVAGIPGRVLDALAGLGTLLLDSGRALVDGFLNGIRGAWDRITSFVRDGMAKLRSLWPFSPAKEGPFSGRGYVTYSGKALTGDFAESLRDGMPGIIASARSIMDAARTELSADLSPAALGAIPGGATAGGGGGGTVDRSVTVTVNNPLPETTSESLNRRARTLAALGG